MGRIVTWAEEEVVSWSNMSHKGKGGASTSRLLAGSPSSPVRPNIVPSSMPYEHTALTPAQAAAIQLLVSQVARAFFEPPYVVILERLMTTRDLWGEMELTHAVGLGQAKKELHKFMVGLIKQRLEVNQNDYLCPRCKKQFNQLDVASLVALTAASGRFDLNCDVCGTEIVQKSKVSGAQQGEQEMDAVNARMQKFNEQTHGIRQTLQKLEKIRYEKIDPLAWLVRHIPETVVFELDEDGNPIKGSDKPKDITTVVPGGLVVVEDDEAKAKREEEQRRMAERQKMQNALPVWHTHSTISGDQTGLGMEHELRQARVATNGQGRAGMGADGGAAGGRNGALGEQDDLSAYYASLNAQPAGEDTGVQSTAVNAQAAFAAGPGDDDEDDMVDVSGGAGATAGPSTALSMTGPAAVDHDADEDGFEETPVAASSTFSADQETNEMAVDPATMVMGSYFSLSDLHSNAMTQRLLVRLFVLPTSVNGEAMPFSQVQDNEDLLDQMTPDEYSVGSNACAC
ncbi:hypothetical protein QFC19_003999 [Naganishia cerealis]|uniref:Uncharacterized protein n=1 Tax=Naganishia cerealis TaxID=610337 RepID=A0ACC2W128_9TREE|nr:hypothetical protein QFC19_003999 [Naganishia cerealis]